MDHWTNREDPKFPTFLKSLSEDVHSPVCPVLMIPGVYIHPTYSLPPTQPLQTLSFCLLIYVCHMLASFRLLVKTAKAQESSVQRPHQFLRFTASPSLNTSSMGCCSRTGCQARPLPMAHGVPSPRNANPTPEGQLMVMVSFRMVSFLHC